MVNAFRVTDAADFPPTPIRDALVDLIMAHSHGQWTDGTHCCLDCDRRAVWTHQEYAEHLALKIRQRRFDLPVETTARSCDCIGYCECGDQG
jgi:hypothetical protein